MGHGRQVVLITAMAINFLRALHEIKLMTCCVSSDFGCGFGKNHANVVLLEVIFWPQNYWSKGWVQLY